MPLLFVIAGAGMWFALNRRSGAQLVGERSSATARAGDRRHVPDRSAADLFRTAVSRAVGGGYLSFLIERVFEFRPYPRGDFSWHHLWFIVYLYVYALLLLPLMLWWKRHQPQIRPGLWIFALGVPLSVNEVAR